MCVFAAGGGAEGEELWQRRKGGLERRCGSEGKGWGGRRIVGGKEVGQVSQMSSQ